MSSDGSSVKWRQEERRVPDGTGKFGLDEEQPEAITKVVEGEAAYRAERHAFYCNVDGGYIILSSKDLTATIEFDDFQTVSFGWQPFSVHVAPGDIDTASSAQ